MTSIDRLLFWLVRLNVGAAVGAFIGSAIALETAYRAVSWWELPLLAIATLANAQALRMMRY